MLHHEANDPVAVKHKVVAVARGIADDGVHAADLKVGRQDHQAAGSLRTTARPNIGRARMTDHAHTDARSRSIDSTLAECLTRHRSMAYHQHECAY